MTNSSASASFSVRATIAPVAFLLAVVAIYAATIYIRMLLPVLDRAGVVAAALTIDLVLVVPLLYYILIVRKKGWPWITVAPVCLLSLLAAWSILPTEHHRLLSVFRVLAAPLELALLAFVGTRAYRGLRKFRRHRSSAASIDSLAAMRRAAREVVEVPVVAEILAYEMAVFYYALFSWRERRPEGSDCFTYFRRTSYGSLMAGLLIVMFAEMVTVHLLLHTYWNSTAAWVVTALSVYGVLWILGDWRAVHLRPTRLSDEHLILRVGIRWEVVVPRASIQRVDRLRGVDQLTDPGAPKDKNTLVAVVLGQPLLHLQLAEPVEACGAYGIKRRVTNVRFAVDESEVLLEQLEQHETPPPNKSLAE